MTVERVGVLYEAFERMPFPRGWAGVDVAGVSLAYVDSMIAGCVGTWLSNGGFLDDWRRRVLRSQLADLDRALPELTGEVAEYFRRLREVAVLVAAELRDR